MLRRLAFVLLVAAPSAQAEPLPAAPEAGGPRAFRVAIERGALNMRESPSTGGAVVAKLEPGALLSNLGCELAEGRGWCDVQSIFGGPRGYAAAEHLAPAIGPDGAAPMGEDDSAYRAGLGDYDATGSIPCALGEGQPTGTCEMGVARGTGGYATLVVKLPEGRERLFFFVLGHAVGASTVEADPTGPFSARREGDLTIIRLGSERYEAPDAAVLGG